MIAPTKMMRLRPLGSYLKLVRQINIDKLSNKRITRLESDIELDDCEFKSRLINRNPRNLEQLSFEKKPTGYWMDRAPRTEWNRLVFEQAGGHLHAYLKHWSGKKILEASTSEPQLAKYFRSPSTVQAAAILGQIISRRCLQSGYLYAGVQEDEESKSPKRKAFYDAVTSNGFVLEEPPEIEPRSATDL